MPRVARIKSNTDTYHVMLRGIEKRNLFLDKSDYNKFLSYIINLQEDTPFNLYAYCLMTNHVHILIKSDLDVLAKFMQRLTISYAQYHNNKYGRTGHLFQNRFKSEPVYDNRYFLTVLRYIHQNPIKAGISKKLSHYPWSSYFEYIGLSSISIVNTSFALDFFQNLKSFEDYLTVGNNDVCMEYTHKTKYTDQALSKLISSISNINNLSSLNISKRNEELKRIKTITGASNRQLSKVINIGRHILDKI